MEDCEATPQFGEEFHIASAIVHVATHDVAAVGDMIGRLDGAQIHLVTPDGRLIVTLESEDEATIPALLSKIREMPGVLGIALVFHHAEAEPSNSPSIGAPCR